ncbi:homoserine dehydrogenase [Facilibium subflavum]|uniref:homoserine dehydrogenase n=1 Tax=Facilibium subflavum TaxID=2219058 RepID=UPI000E64B88B|nr:homoserine dehydrogenase [Facilibium subflavum]
MNEQRIALIGCGTVGQGLLEILQQKKQTLSRHHGYHFKLVAISDFKLGSIYHPEGLNIDRVLHAIQSNHTLDTLADQHSIVGFNAIQTITETNANVICEATYTDIKTGGAAFDHHRTAFLHGKHVVTTNKGPIVVAWPELSQLAIKHGCFWGIEGTVISGTPVIKTIQAQLKGTEIKSISGIFNGTTNYMLSEMTNGTSYENALQKAQSLGYAEADPTADVEGFDVLAKVAILANVIFNTNLEVDQIPCQGITKLTGQDIIKAKEQGKVWKLIGQLSQSDEGIKGEVKTVCLEKDDPLASISGATNALMLDTDLLGKVTISGPGAGKKETGFALLSDLLALNELQQLHTKEQTDADKVSANGKSLSH